MAHQSSDDTGVPWDKYRILSGYAVVVVVPFSCYSEEGLA